MSEIFTFKSREEILFEYKSKTNEFIKILYSNKWKLNGNYNEKAIIKYLNHYLNDVLKAILLNQKEGPYMIPTMFSIFIRIFLELKGELKNPPINLAILYERFNTTALESKRSNYENFITINLPFQVSHLTYDYLFSSLVKGTFQYKWLDIAYWKGYYNEIPLTNEFEKCRQSLRKLLLFASSISENLNID